MDKICIIIPVHNRKEITLNCLQQLQHIKNNGFEYKIVIIDDGSTDGTYEIISKNYAKVEIIRGDGTLWWAGGINKGLKYAQEHKYDFVYTLNDDIKIFPDTLQLLYDAIKQNMSSVFTSAKINENNELLYAGFKYVGFFQKIERQLIGRVQDLKNSDYVEADTLNTQSTLIPIKIIETVGYFDDQHFPHNYSDFDYFISVKNAGFPLFVNLKSNVFGRYSNSNFHQLVLNNNTIYIIKTFFNKKYGNHVQSIFNLATKRKGILFGYVSFLYLLLPYFVWLLLKIVLPKSGLYKILKATRRID